MPISLVETGRERVMSPNVPMRRGETSRPAFEFDGNDTVICWFLPQKQLEFGMSAEPEARAALTLIESLLVSLSDRGLLDGAELDEIYDAAVASHRDRSDADDLADRTISVLERLRTQANGARTGR